MGMKYEIISAESIPANPKGKGTGIYAAVLSEALELQKGEALKFKFDSEEESRKFRTTLYTSARRNAHKFWPLSIKMRGYNVFVVKEADDAC